MKTITVAPAVDTQEIVIKLQPSNVGLSRESLEPLIARLEALGADVQLEPASSLEERLRRAVDRAEAAVKFSKNRENWAIKERDEFQALFSKTRDALDVQEEFFEKLQALQASFASLVSQSRPNLAAQTSPSRFCANAMKVSGKRLVCTLAPGHTEPHSAPHRGGVHRWVNPGQNVGGFQNWTELGQLSPDAQAARCRSVYQSIEGSSETSVVSCTLPLGHTGLHEDGRSDLRWTDELSSGK